MRFTTVWKQGGMLPSIELVRIGDLQLVLADHCRMSIVPAVGRACVDADMRAWAAEIEGVAFLAGMPLPDVYRLERPVGYQPSYMTNLR